MDHACYQRNALERDDAFARNGILHLVLNRIFCLFLRDHHSINPMGIIPKKLDILIASSRMGREVFRKWRSG